MNIQRLRENVGLVYLGGVLGAFLIVGILIWAMIRYTQPAPLDTQRAAARAKALAELRGAEKQALETTGWVDQGKGIVRLRIEDALKLVEREWQNPAAARSNLIARVGKAKALPPKPPEQPSPYE
jgi:uncharacterized protein YdaU (DUF1376 family)